VTILPSESHLEIAMALRSLATASSMNARSGSHRLAGALFPGRGGQPCKSWPVVAGSVVTRLRIIWATTEARERFPSTWNCARVARWSLL